MNTDAGSFEAAALNHLCDALDTTFAQRWEWLQQAMAFGSATARTRAGKGLITLGAQGELLWSPLHESLWTQQHRSPDAAELDLFLAGRA